MPYPKKLLNDYETVALDLHPHWWYFSKPAVLLVASIVFGIVARVYLDGDDEEAVSYLAIGLIVFSAFWLAARYAKWANTNFVITSDRIIFRSGVVAKSGIEIPLERVNNVLFSQSLFERLLGAGDLLIESGGEAGQQRFSDIRRPGSRAEPHPRPDGGQRVASVPAADRHRHRCADPAREAGRPARTWDDHPRGVRGAEAARCSAADRPVVVRRLHRVTLVR